MLRVGGVRHAVVLSNDGLPVGASTALTREDAEHLAAVASGFHSLAKGAGRHFRTGGVRQTMVEMDDAFLFVAAAGDGSCLTVRSSVTADIGASSRTRWPAWSSEWASTSTRRRASPRNLPQPDDGERPVPMSEDSTGIPHQPGSQWYDNEAGPLVRPYAMTGGRTEPGPSGVRFDLIALVTLDAGTAGLDDTALDVGATGLDDTTLGPEHRALIPLCHSETQSVAELAAGVDLPVGVVRVLLGDLLETGSVKVSRPVPPARLPDEKILREVIDGLRAL